MTDAIFLSAGVPDPRRGPEYAKTADTVAIAAAVSALVHVALGRRLLVWGGQPAITPMIWVVAEGLGVDYGRWVRLYQSKHFKDEFPEDNKRFSNVEYIEDLGDRERSLLLMRERMFSDYNFTAAVFIGGMKGIIDEFELLEKMQPTAIKIPVMSAGGATLDLAQRIGTVSTDLATNMDYIALFHRHLGISVKENRYQTPEAQPASIVDRLWRQ
ncbi:hypothetical protein G6L67_04135 [Agrobacterium tumefaciens]|jgi:hypothetical protein|uniref:Uncharacterized protein n=1 Tax=Agrobacterium tumefaciens str. Kerr 14 TaxID=1183424 RepID=A0A1S7Q369_AGRTU|nr:hypothetical protein [Agrobacterium tumefaciens]AYM80336.1 hypothetical protein At12D1_04490 [Agrobacterium tumefaciens]NTE91035.1 hypothetical protein [Agrobacterium tumefaciens]CUX30369.1 conserved hypothetical protein [Agrobacterium tumefaciens str. Kerr 14]